MICHGLLCVLNTSQIAKESPCGEVINVLDCNILVSEFELQLRYCIDFRTNILKKGISSLIPHYARGYIDSLLFFLRMDLALNNPQKMICP